MKKINTKISLIIFNLIPLAGVVFFSWNFFSVILVYWLENIVVGFYNILKIKKAKGLVVDKNVRINGKTLDGWSKMGIILFFILHFGIFTFVHGVFVFAIFFDGSVNFSAILLGFLGLLISHGISYYYNFIGKEEYKKVSATQVMSMPYSRVVVLHFVVITGGFLIKAFNSGVLVIALLVIIKIVVDMSIHKKEHLKISQTI